MIQHCNLFMGTSMRSYSLLVKACCIIILVTGGPLAIVQDT